MRTLGKNITQRFFLTEDGYGLMRKRWSELINGGHQPDSREFLLYLILRGKDYHKAFSPAHRGLSVALSGMRHKKGLEERINNLFKGVVDPEAVYNTVRFLAPSNGEPYNDMIKNVDSLAA